MFTKNLSAFERNTRISAGLILDMWFFSGQIEGLALWLAGVACVYLPTTASASRCPVYAVLA